MPLSLRGRDETALQSRRRTDQRPTSKDAGAETPQCGEGRTHIPIHPYPEETQVARLTRERNESEGAATATSEVLRVMSGSHGDLNPVFDTILNNAMSLCEANFGVLLLFDGDEFRIAATRNAPPAFAELRRRQPEVRSSGSWRVW